jgi:hypothetical protein
MVTVIHPAGEIHRETVTKTTAAETDIPQEEVVIRRATISAGAPETPAAALPDRNTEITTIQDKATAARHFVAETPVTPGQAGMEIQTVTETATAEIMVTPTATGTETETVPEIT